MEEKTDYASLSPSDATLLDSPIAPAANLKSEDNPFSTNPYSPEADIYPTLPSPQGVIPQAVTTPLPHGPVLINGVYYQPVPAPHSGRGTIIGPRTIHHIMLFGDGYHTAYLQLPHKVDKRSIKNPRYKLLIQHSRLSARLLVVEAMLTKWLEAAIKQFSAYSESF